MLEQFEALPEAQGYEETSTAARRALALNPSLADAHATLAFVDFFWSRNADDAEREFRTALVLDPNSAIAHQRYGIMLLDLRRFPQALAELDTALRLQPGSTAVVAGRALALGFNGHRDEAVDILQAVAAQQPQNPIIYKDLSALAQIQPHNIPLYLESTRRLQQIEYGARSLPWVDAASAAYRSGGEPAMWRAIVAAESKDAVPSSLAAKGLAQLGQSSAALDILEADAQRPQAATAGFAIDPLLFDPLRHESRYQALLVRTGLAPRQ
jgi:tetratricopeptide (TPR) repeat protein